MNQLDSIVIAGGGLAGTSAAFALRERGFARRLTLVGEEQTPPYERPPLSKGYLRGESTLEAAYVRALPDYAAQGVELLRGRRAVTLDPATRQLNLDDGSSLSYDALLIATGAAPRRLGSTRADLLGLHYLRNAEDADAIREAAGAATAIAVIGGGWVGSEVAASLRQLGHEVTLVSSLPRPLERVLGPEVAEVYRGLHIEHGVRLAHGHVSGLEGVDHVVGMRLADGQRLPADMVVVGVGAAPRIKLATQAGLETTDGGIAVDEYLRTSVPDIYAAGDVAAAWHPRFGRHLRVEHWDNAIQQGRSVGANILGANEPYARTPYFYSDQFDLGMEYRGFAPHWDTVVVRGDLPKREFHAFWLANGRVMAAMNANLWDDGEELQRLVESEERVDLARLADSRVPLAEAA
ncbi:MAG TPA: FAD-dependent oxidoreductase [Candidatus Limnocylindrales bacterium]|jgi:3-phenylpropionate/trans-cinnamate dioxygenase ferredoxin reductase subunit|nr:FAD-dependent oxidoreductase [Candidatus Limnocylindrales bacterium]